MMGMESVLLKARVYIEIRGQGLNHIGGQPGILILSLPWSMTLFSYDWPLLRRAGRLQRQAFGLLPEPTLFLLRVIAAGALEISSLLRFRSRFFLQISLLSSIVFSIAQDI
jgi:hypothetical protein